MANWGERGGNTKLTEVQVREIRNLWESGGCLITNLAKIYGVTNSCISSIVNNKSWRHIL